MPHLGWIAGAFAFGAGTLGGIIKIAMSIHNRRNRLNGNNPTKYVSEKTCRINRKLFEDRDKTIFKKLDEHGAMLTEVRTDIKLLLQK